MQLNHLPYLGAYKYQSLITATRNLQISQNSHSFCKHYFIMQSIVDTWYIYVHIFSICTLLLIIDTEVWMNSAQYLFKFKRGVEAIRGDGNCLFRALSRILCGNEDNHSFIRRTLVTFATHNKSWVQKFCHPLPIEYHLNGMKSDRIWGTDLKYTLLLLFGKSQYMCAPKIQIFLGTFQAD